MKFDVREVAVSRRIVEQCWEVVDHPFQVSASVIAMASVLWNHGGYLVNMGLSQVVDSAGLLLQVSAYVMGIVGAWVPTSSTRC